MKKRLCPLAYLIFLMLLFLLALYCTSHTSLLVDDYAYMFDFSKDWGIPGKTVRISHVSQIVASMAAHRQRFNGRLISHGLVQLLLMFPKWIFNVLNAVMFVNEVLLITASATPSGKTALRLLISAFVLSVLWHFQMNFGEVNFWLDGAVNYLWGAVFGLLFFYAYYMVLQDGNGFGGCIKTVGMLFLSFVVGAYNESLGCTAIVFAVMMIFYMLLIQKKKLSAFVYLSLAMTIAGFAFLYTAPATLSNKIYGGSVIEALSSGAIHNVIPLLQMSKEMIPLMILTALLTIMAIVSKVKKDLICFSIIVSFSAFFCFMTLTLSNSVPKRAAFFIPVLLCLSSSVLISELLEGKNQWMHVTSGLIVLVLLLLLPFSITNAIQDISRVYEKTEADIEYIQTCKQNGVMEITLSDVPRDGLSKYVALRELLYLNWEDCYSWPNIHMSNYYGVDVIHGVRELS